MSWGWTALTNLPLRGKFINTVQFASQADPSVETLSDDAGLEHPPLVGLDVFLAYLLHVYMETMVDMHQSQSQKTVLWHPALQTCMFWSFGKHWRIALHLHSQLAVCSQCTGAAWHLETDLHQHAEDIRKGWQGDSVQVTSPSGQPTPSALQASWLELVGLPPRTSCSCNAISRRLDFSFKRLTGTRLNLNLSKLVVVWDWYGTNEHCLAYF